LASIHGYPLGKLHKQGHINDDQYAAGNEWAAMVRAYAGMMGIPLGSPKSGSMSDYVAAGFYAWEGDKADRDPEEDEKRRKRLKDRYDSCYNDLAAVGLSIGKPHAILEACRKVCIYEFYPLEHELGDLRMGLNSLHRKLFKSACA